MAGGNAKASRAPSRLACRPSTSTFALALAFALATFAVGASAQNTTGLYSVLSGFSQYVPSRFTTVAGGVPIAAALMSGPNPCSWNNNITNFASPLFRGLGCNAAGNVTDLVLDFAAYWYPISVTKGGVTTTTYNGTVGCTPYGGGAGSGGTGCAPGLVPGGVGATLSSFTSLTNLQFLSGVSISGSLPTEIGQLLSLQTLAIRLPGINGQYASGAPWKSVIPASWASLTNLTSLTLNFDFLNIGANSGRRGGREGTGDRGGGGRGREGGSLAQHSS